jgi:hypothetical protein
MPGAHNDFALQEAIGQPPAVVRTAIRHDEHPSIVEFGYGHVQAAMAGSDHLTMRTNARRPGHR